jgi:predicted SnoaL-like aldol condensation-catalyzing enzyme
MSKLESAMRVVLAFHEAFNSHDVTEMMRLMSDDCTFEGSGPPPDGAVYSGIEAVTSYWQAFFSASPKAQVEIEEIFGLADRCIMRWNRTWLDREGSERRIRGVDIFRVRDGIVHEHFSYVKA